MPAFYRYSFAILGSSSTDGSGAAIDYDAYPQGTWQYSGSQTHFVVEEKNRNNSDFDGDHPAGFVGSDSQIGQGNAQTTNIDGSARQVLWDYSFEVIDPETGQTWQIGVIDVDLNNDDDVQDASEAGYYLIFIDGVPPPDTVLTVGAITADSTKISHIDLGGTVVCFAEGTLIETQVGPRPIEALRPGDMVLTRDAGYQPLRWSGRTKVPAEGKLAPIVIEAGVLKNEIDLVVSPQHAILLDDWRAELFYGEKDVLVRAVDLLGQAGVSRRTGGRIAYHHILFDAHHLVNVGGQWCESLYPGDMTLQTVNEAASEEIQSLFPDLKGYGPKAARCLRQFEAVCLAA